MAIAAFQQENRGLSVPRLEEKVAFLSRPESYPEATGCVETIETHMSWIFLTDSQAWKLKKPSCFDYLDLSSPEARWRNCEEEIRLNRRLAPNVYRRVVPIVVRAGTSLYLDASGIVDDWLVCMRRLPSNRMLDHVIANRNWSNEHIRSVGAVLAHFYSNAAPVSMATENHLDQLKKELLSSRHALARREQLLSPKLIDSAVEGALSFIDGNAAMFNKRAKSGKIVEGHGDLRPEHICLEDEPVIIDCLEFNRDLRILDPASELTFLNLECDRLGAPEVGRLILEMCCALTDDDPPQQLLEFYRTYHAAVRAKIALGHLRDYAVHDAQKWIERAEHYLKMAA